ncbi:MULTISPECIES: thermonuclease family protein [unclassified Mameliella]|uniref:thermonuclease family protein n=1 Tax=unclassified Mameliella TaxID=2630630 RepID=UPI00273EDA3A|nr:MULTISPECIES: thermonuclease family protein [unclassified Mameliella]
MDRATDQRADPSLVSGRVTQIRDGDTIEVSGIPIRLNGLNCEERGSDLGKLATAAMRDLIEGQDLTCRLNGDRTYDREVGRCVLDDGRDIGAVLIGQGVCGRCARFDPQGGYIEVQRQVGPFAGEVPGYCTSR